MAGIISLSLLYSQALLMALKDYYTILDLPPGADRDDIKKAYRQLVMQYHPDRNQGNPYAAAHFREIREAYDILSDPLKREDYHQQRGYWKSTGKAFAETGPMTPQKALLQVRKLKERVGVMDIFRMDHHALHRQILAFLSEDVFRQLEAYHELKSNEEIILDLLNAAAPLPYALTETLMPGLKRLAGPDALTLEKIDAFRRQKRREHYLNRYRTPVLLVVTLILCYLVYRLAI